ncbi:MAG: thiolase family protein [Bdellovibrionales bacterium]|nr:thiolase family protein [Bdellovibrionales bacterium]
MDSYILSAKRTPIGSFMGALSSTPAPQLGSQVIKSLLKSNNNKTIVPIEDIQECFMGQVLTAGSGQAPARQSALYAGLKNTTQCMTINKVCGSGLKAVMLAQDSIALGRSDVVIAGGQENMSLTPYLLPKARVGLRLGPGNIEDGIIKDGLWDPYHNFHMGNAGEICAREHKISREQQDEFAVKSYKKAQKAQQKGRFQQEIEEVEVSSKKTKLTVNEDEEPGKVLFDKISHLKPAFEKAGSITPANASKINDGAAACLIVSEQYMKSEKQKPLARIIAQGHFAQAPEYFTTAPVQAIRNCLQNANMKLSDIDLFEINEAFSVVALAVSKELNIPEEKLNVHGGAVALGHPIGASGARILTTLIYALHQYNKKYGIAGICLGGGEAVAVLIENKTLDFP